MINRTMVRTKVLQTLFAYYKDGDKTPLTARKELLKSYADTYDLYVILLDFVNALTDYAEQQIEQAAAQRALSADGGYHGGAADFKFVQCHLYSLCKHSFFMLIVVR